MTTSPPRTCFECAAVLPAATTARKTYCGDRCRDRAKKRRQRDTATKMAKLKAELEKSRRREQRLETLLAQGRSRLRTRDRSLLEAKKQHRRAHWSVTGHAHRAVRSQVSRIVDTRDRLAAVTATLEDQMSGKVDRSDLELAARQIVDLQRRVSETGDRYDRLAATHQELRDRYDRLASKASQLREALDRLTGDRARFRTVLAQWDVLAGRLARSSRNTRLSEGDRAIVRTWSAWSQLTAQTDRSARRSPSLSTGQSNATSWSATRKGARS